MREKYVAELHRRLYTEEYSWGPAFIGYARQMTMMSASSVSLPLKKAAAATGSARRLWTL